MATSVTGTSAARAYDVRTETAVAASVPWPLYAVAVAATCVVVGLIWDISWHMTIGRDTFWTPAHMLEYLAGAIIGVSCGWVALHTTFAGTPDERARAVRFWGFRAPLGAWIAVWGSFAMLTSAPFDNWWHDAYGLDVKIISPPHTLLVLGMGAMVVGALVWTLAWQNRATDAGQRRRLEWLFVYAAAMLLSMVSLFVLEKSDPRGMHATRFYRVAAMAYPVVLLAAARGSSMRWPATTTAAIYMAVRILMGWILPLFPATPKLGPIFHPIDHMAALYFPVVLVVPALAIDLLTRRLGRASRPARDLRLAPLYALVFVAALVAVQWPAGSFLLSPAARNWLFFADRNLPYFARFSDPANHYRFYYGSWTDHTAGQYAAGFAWALLWATLSAYAGMAWGRWMGRVRR